MDTIKQIIGLLFLGRDLAHREHLLTDNYAHHVALGEFYPAVVELADKLAETAMGRLGSFDSLPLVENEFEGGIDDVLEDQAAWIEDHRDKDKLADERPLQNIVDEVLALYGRTVYKLRQFK